MNFLQFSMDAHIEVNRYNVKETLFVFLKLYFVLVNFYSPDLSPLQGITNV